MRTRTTVIYARVSSSRQADALPAQAGEVRQAARAAGHDRVEVVSEVSSGRGRPPALAELVRRARRGEVARVFVRRVDRLGRNAREISLVWYTLEDAGVDVHVLEPAIGPDTPGRRLLVAVLGELAQLEVEQRSAAIRAGQARSKKKNGRPRIRWRQAEDIRRLRAEGLSVREVARLCHCGRTTVLRYEGKGIATAGTASDSVNRERT